jgi:hypothetical protein
LVILPVPRFGSANRKCTLLHQVVMAVNRVQLLRSVLMATAKKPAAKPAAKKAAPAKKPAAKKAAPAKPAPAPAPAAAPTPAPAAPVIKPFGL